MTDCYSILGVPHNASPVEIRAAFLAKMKQLHPDMRRDGSPVEGEAGEISHAYWQLRDAARRAEHDRFLADCAPARPARARAKARSRQRARTTAVARTQSRAAPAKPAPTGRRRPRRARRLDALRTAAGVMACAVAVAGFALAFTYLEPRAGARAEAATSPNARQVPVGRRAVSAVSVTDASGAFREIVRRSGLEGAHLYTRQCLLELVAHPTITMLDYCVAFDDAAAEWETAFRGRADHNPRRFFAADQRFGRYRSVLRELRSGEVREALLTDLNYFAEVGR